MYEAITEKAIAAQLARKEATDNLNAAIHDKETQLFNIREEKDRLIRIGELSEVYNSVALESQTAQLLNALEAEAEALQTKPLISYADFCEMVEGVREEYAAAEAAAKEELKKAVAIIEEQHAKLSAAQTEGSKTLSRALRDLLLIEIRDPRAQHERRKVEQALHKPMLDFSAFVLERASGFIKLLKED